MAATKRLSFLIIIWAIADGMITIFVRYLTHYFDGFTLNAYRYLVGSLSLLIISYLVYRRDLLRMLRKRRLLWITASLAVLSLGAQYLWTEAVALTPAVMAGLLTILGVPVNVFVAMFVFSDERGPARSPVFILGSCLALGGAAGLTLTQGRLSPGYALGALLIFVTIAIDVGATILSKKAAVEGNPICVSGLKTAIMCVLFFTGSLLRGNPASIVQVPARATVVLFASGIYGIFVGTALYMVLLRKVGVVATRFAMLSVPAFTGIAGYLLFGETMGPVQLLCGAVLVAGSFLVLNAASATAQHTKPAVRVELEPSS